MWLLLLSLPLPLCLLPELLLKELLLIPNAPVRNMCATVPIKTLLQDYTGTTAAAAPAATAATAAAAVATAADAVA